MMDGQLNKRKFHLDPRTKLFIIALIATLEMMDKHILVTAALGVIPFVLFLSNRQFAGAFKFLGIFSLAVLAHIFRADMQINMVLNMIIVLLGGLVLALFPAFACGDYILKSTTVSEAISALEKLKVGRKITIPLSVMFRFFPTIRQEHRSIHDAAMMRGLTIGRKRFWKNPAQALEYRVVPLLISIANIGTDLSAAALSRGLDNPIKHTTYADVKMTRRDYLTILAIVSFLTLVYLLSSLVFK